MSKKSLVLYRNESTVIKEVKAGDYVIAERGYLFNDVHTKRCEIIIEGELSISLTDKYKVITSDEATALINEYKQPASYLASIKQELEKCKKELEEYKNSDIAELKKENEALKLKIAELDKTAADSKKKA